MKVINISLGLEGGKDLGLSSYMSSTKLSKWMEFQEQSSREEVWRQKLRSIYLGEEIRTD